MTTPGSAELLALADDCERYAKIIEGIIVVPDDYRDGDGTERREPRATLLKAAVALRLAAKPAEEDIARIKVQRDNALLDMERFMNEAQSAGGND